MLRVKADTEQACAAERWVRCDLLVNLAEVVAHPRAEVRERTARIDKRHHQHLAAELLQRNMLSVLVGELEVRHFFPRRRHMKGFWTTGGRPGSVAHDLHV